MKSQTIHRSLGVFFAGAFTTLTPAATLIHHWKFDETSGLSAADSADNLAGTLVNFDNTTADEQWIPGVIGGALNLIPETDGSVNNHVALGTGLTTVDNTVGFSVSASMRIDRAVVPGGERNVFAADNGFSGIPNAEVNLGHVGVSLSSWSGVFTTATNVISLQDWMHVGLTQSDSDGKTLYLNGLEVATDSAGTNAWTDGVEAWLGGRPQGSRWIEGAIDDISLWSGVLTEDEMALLHQGGLQGFDAATVIPEPATSLLAVIGLLPLFRRSRKK